MADFNGTAGDDISGAFDNFYGNDGNDGDDGKRIVASVHGMGQLLECEWGHSSEVRIMAARTSSGRVSGTITPST